MAAAIEAAGWRAAASALGVGAALMLAAGPLQAEPDVARGEALYENHCRSCHTCKVHARRELTVRDVSQLMRQVDRWQAEQKLGWNAEEQAAVVEYLNRAYYHF